MQKQVLPQFSAGPVLDRNGNSQKVSIGTLDSCSQLCPSVYCVLSRFWSCYYLNIVYSYYMFYWQPYFDDSSASTLVFLITAFYHSLSSQTRPKRHSTQVDNRSPPCHPRCPLRCPTTTKAEGSQVVTVKGNEQQRDFADEAWTKLKCYPLFTLIFYLLGTLPNCID